MSLDANIVNADVNGNIPVTLPSVTNQAGFAVLAGNNSNTGDPAGHVSQQIRTSTQGRLTVGQPVMLFNEVPNLTTLNSAKWTAPVTTYTITAANGLYNLNAGAVTTASAVARMSTYAFFPFQSDFATYCVFDFSFSVAPEVNNTIEAGFIQCTGTAAPTDGAFFRFDATGTLKAVLNNNGVEFTSSALSAPSANTMHKYKIICENDRVLYYIDDACQYIASAPAGLGMPMYAAAQPWTIRTYNAGSAPALAQVVKLGYLWVGLQDAATLGKDNATIAALRQGMGSQGQDGMTMGSTALYTNSLAAGAGTLMTNTTAALGSGLGGQFSALPTLAVGTDGVLSSYQNPAATSAIPGKTLYLRGVKVHGAVTTILAGGPVTYAYSLAYGHNNVTLATTESTTAKAPRRVPIGFETFAATAAVGTLGSPNGAYMPFNAPIAINPGEFVQVVAKNLGVVTTTGVITCLVSFDSYWE